MTVMNMNEKLPFYIGEYFGYGNVLIFAPKVLLALPRLDISHPIDPYTPLLAFGATSVSDGIFSVYNVILISNLSRRYGASHFPNLSEKKSQRIFFLYLFCR